jgi:type II secretory pathway pseudopilin PulG
MDYIKTNNKWARQRGTTLVELSVVIAVILLLVSVLFIGVSAWRNGANRAACLVNISSVQKAVRGYQNLHADNPAIVGVDMAGLIADGYFGVAPAEPAGGTYTVAANPFPAASTAAMTCSLAAAPNLHAPTSTTNW